MVKKARRQTPCIDVLHIKDFTIEDGGMRKSVVLGHGAVDYTALRTWAHRTERPVYLVREGLKTEFSGEELEYLRQF